MFIWMVSNPVSLAPELQEDWLGTEVISMGIYLYLVSPLVPQGFILVMAPELQEDWSGTKDEIGSSNIHLYNSNLHLNLVPQEILVMAPELQEVLLGTKVEKVTLLISMSLYLLIHASIRIARGLGWYNYW